MKRILLAATMFVAGHIYSGAFPYIFNTIGAGVTTACLYHVHMFYNKVTDDRIRTSDPARPEIRTYIENCASQMPDVNRDDLNNMDIREEQITISLNGALFHTNRHQTPALFVEDFQADANETQNRQQYMLLAHELGHFYHKDTIRSRQPIYPTLIGGSIIYPCVSRLVTSCIRHPYARAAIFPAALGVSTAGQMFSARGISSWICRNQERRADQFALQQARSLHNIYAFAKFLNEDKQKQEDSYLKKIFSTHPDTRERYGYIVDFYNRKKAEGWKE